MIMISVLMICQSISLTTALFKAIYLNVYIVESTDYIWIATKIRIRHHIIGNRTDSAASGCKPIQQFATIRKNLLSIFQILLLLYRNFFKYILKN
jgi:hypothetical protein